MAIGPERGLGDVGHVPPYLPVLLRLSSPSPRLLAQINLAPSHPSIPAALFLHQAERHILSLNGLTGCLLSFLA